MTVYQQISANKRRTVMLIIAAILLIVALGWLIGELTEVGPSGLVIALVISGIMALTSYYGGDKLALWTAGAVGPLKAEINPYIYRLVENLSITAGLTMPKIYLIPDQAPNAFATGRDPQHASIALTQGLVAMLENEELEGVIAHELSHIKNFDTRIMMVVIVCVGAISLLANWFWRFSFFGNNRRSSRDNGLGLILMIVGIVLIAVSPIISKLIQLAISRKREFLADASGALLTRYPEGLARALEKIEAAATPMNRANTATAHLYISNPFGKNKLTWRNLFSTHPPTAERTQALRAMA